MTLEHAAVFYWHIQRQHPLVLLEVSDMWVMHRCDVVAVSKNRMAIEVEIKRTLADFKHDAAKSCHLKRLTQLDPFRQFYYLVPAALADKVRPILPPYAGLLVRHTDAPQSILVDKKAPINEYARKLSLHRIQKLVARQTRMLMDLIEHSYATPNSVDIQR